MNVNLLTPGGQFGTRRMGGKDHASARYVFTKLEKITRAIFHPDGDDLLHYLNDEGLSIEPEYYMPVIPVVLMNGSDGIGTGWSSTIQKYAPREILSNIRKMIQGEEPVEMHPHFSGYTGEIIAEHGKREGSYIVKGKIERIDDTTLLITELPIGKWTQDYKAFLEGLMTGTEKTPSEISDFKEGHTDTTVHFTVIATKAKVDEFEKAKGGLVGKFKLSTTISTNNMTLFDEGGKIHKYKTALDILKMFHHHRLGFYVKRKALLLKKMAQELKVLSNKARFVEEVCRGELIVSNRKRKELLADLQERGYDLILKEDKKAKFDEGEADDEDPVDESASDADLAKGYEYLLGMKIWSLTFERAEELRRQKAEKEGELKKLEATAPEAIWLTDLDAIEEALDERDVEIAKDLKKEEQAQGKNKAQQAKKKVAAAKRAKKAKRGKDTWDSDLEDSDDDDFGSAKAAPKARSAPKAAAKKKAAKPPAKKPIASAIDETVDGLEKLSLLMGTEPATSNKVPAPEKAPAKPAKKATAKAAKKPAKKTYDSDDESDNFLVDSDSEAEVVAPAPKKAPAKPAKKAPVKAAKKPAKKTYAQFDSSDDDSDAEMAPVKQAPVKAPAKAAKKAPSKRPAKKTYDSTDEDSDAFMGDSDSDAPVTKAPVKASAKAAKKVPAETSEESDHSMAGDDSEAEVVPTKKAPVKAAKKAPAKKALAKKAPAKKAPAKKAPAKKPAKKAYDSSDEDSDDFMGDSDSDSESESERVSAPVAPRARSGRAAAKKITYVIDDSEDESFGGDSDEESDF